MEVHKIYSALCMLLDRKYFAGVVCSKRLGKFWEGSRGVSYILCDVWAGNVLQVWC